MDFTEANASVNQSDKKLIMNLLRRNGSKGRVVVPWHVETEFVDFPYAVSLEKKKVSLF